MPNILFERIPLLSQLSLKIKYAADWSSAKLCSLQTQLVAVVLKFDRHLLAVRMKLSSRSG
jgi:hypothetical protein